MRWDTPIRGWGAYWYVGRLVYHRFNDSMQAEQTTYELPINQLVLMFAPWHHLFHTGLTRGLVIRLALMTSCCSGCLLPCDGGPGHDSVLEY